MINREKLNAKELADIVFEVQRRVYYRFDLLDVFNIMRYTIHKAEQTGHDESYVPLLLRTELEDFVMRERINALGKRRMENGLQMCQENGRVSRVVV